MQLGEKQEQSLACFLSLFPPPLFFSQIYLFLYLAFKAQNEAAGPKEPRQERGAGLCVPGQAQPWAPGACAEPQIPRIQLEKQHLLNSAGILGSECTGSSTLNNTTNGHKAEIASWANTGHKDGVIKVTIHTEFTEFRAEFTETAMNQVLQSRLVSVTDMG